jgi:hypothetical protein
MSGLDLSHLSPGDAVAALRSYPRRFRELFASVDEAALPDAAVDHADHVARSLAMIGQALHQVLVQDRPTLLPAVLDDAAREWAHAGSSSVDDVLDFLTVEANALADAVSDVPADAWTRPGLVAGRESEVTALDLLREAVRTGSDHLRAAEAAVRSAP